MAKVISHPLTSTLRRTENERERIFRKTVHAGSSKLRETTEERRAERSLEGCYVHFEGDKRRLRRLLEALKWKEEPCPEGTRLAAIARVRGRRACAPPRLRWSRRFDILLINRDVIGSTRSVKILRAGSGEVGGNMPRQEQAGGLHPIASCLMQSMVW